MKKTVAISVIVTLVLVSSAFAADIIGRHNLSDDRGLVRVKSIEGRKMSVDVIYTPRKGRLIILTDVYADYNLKAQKAIYSEDRFCPDALKMKFLSNGQVVLNEAACADF